MNNVIKILMKRDGISYEDARDQVLICKKDLENGDWEAIMNDLGLEDDYIFDILDVK